MANIEFESFGKIPRLYRDIVVTEKIDGSNGAVGIKKFPFGWHVGGIDPETGIDHDMPANAVMVFGPNNTDYDNGGCGLPDSEYLVWAQSRKRVITPEADNFGFARWVYNNRATLIDDLGPGLHFGEWWGNGIQRGYGLPNGDKRFSLFNVKRWEGRWFTTPSLEVVPVVERGEFSTVLVKGALMKLKWNGSFAAPGYLKPEGVVIFHPASNQLFKATIDNDEEPKSKFAEGGTIKIVSGQRDINLELLEDKMISIDAIFRTAELIEENVAKSESR